MKSYSQSFQMLPSDFLQKTNPVMLVAYSEVFADEKEEEEEEEPQTKEGIIQRLSSVFGSTKM